MLGGPNLERYAKGIREILLCEQFCVSINVGYTKLIVHQGIILLKE